MEILALSADGSVLGRRSMEKIAPAAPAVHMDLLRYWESLPLGASAARKADFDPGELVRHLPSVFMCERPVPVSERSLVFRVHGSMIADILRCDLTGKNVADALPPQRRSAVMRAIDLSMDEECPVRQRFYSAFPGREHVLVDRLIVPLADGQGVLRFALGCLSRCALGDPEELFLID